MLLETLYTYMTSVIRTELQILGKQTLRTDDPEKDIKVNEINSLCLFRTGTMYVVFIMTLKYKSQSN